MKGQKRCLKGIKMVPLCKEEPNSATKGSVLRTKTVPLRSRFGSSFFSEWAGCLTCPPKGNSYQLAGLISMRSVEVSIRTEWKMPAWKGSTDHHTDTAQISHYGTNWPHLLQQTSNLYLCLVLVTQLTHPDGSHTFCNIEDAFVSYSFLYQDAMNHSKTSKCSIILFLVLHQQVNVTCFLQLPLFCFSSRQTY